MSSGPLGSIPRGDSQLQPFLKKDVGLRVGPRHLRLAVSQELFSSQDVDKGTRLLLRTLLKQQSRSRPRVLDLGCGYGPIGLAMQAHDPTSSVQLADRDALAVAFANENARRNGIDQAAAYGSLVYDDVGSEQFDLIASNIPGKGPEALHRHWLLAARSHLSAAGVVAVVVVRPLVALVTEVLAGPGVRVVLREEHNTHAVFHYCFEDSPSGAIAPSTAFGSGVLTRSLVPVRTAGVSYEIQAAYGLPEFDSLTFSTSMLIEALAGHRGTASTAVCVNPGQGHLPVALWKLFQPESMTVVDRDLLALRTTQANLVRNGSPDHRMTLVHGLGVPEDAAGGADLVVDHLRPKEPPQATVARLLHTIGHLKPGSRLLIGGTSTAVTRAVAALEKNPTVSLLARHRRDRHSVAWYERR